MLDTKCRSSCCTLEMTKLLLVVLVKIYGPNILNVRLDVIQAGGSGNVRKLKSDQG